MRKPTTPTPPSRGDSSSYFQQAASIVSGGLIATFAGRANRHDFCRTLTAPVQLLHDGPRQRQFRLNVFF
jgi:hypothetical protein